MTLSIMRSYILLRLTSLPVDEDLYDIFYLQSGDTAYEVDIVTVKWMQIV